jgi:NAD(P)-dependent dehydrogenase (short-subunit alcohol dehydrogenase family)
MKLKDKTVIVTGGGSGIGRTIALKMAREGGRVFICGRTGKKLEESRELARSEGLDLHAIVADVSKSEDVKNLVQKVVDETGRLDTLVNNAALLTKPGPIETIAEEDWDAVMSINLKGPFLCCREAAPHMRAQRSGKIVNISSIGAFFAFRPILPYAASKAGLSGLTKMLAIDLAPYNICVNAVLPGPVASGLWEDVTSEERKAFFNKRIPMGRVAAPEEVANLVCFLGSDEADYLTGESIVIAGGLPGVPQVDF